MTFRRLVLVALTTALGLSLAGCDLAGTNEESAAVTSGVFVANQGNFFDGNGSVSVYDPVSETASPNAIDNLNSIVQSIRLRDDRLYLAANSAGRLDVFDASDQTPAQQLSGFDGPRYLTFPDDDTAFLTDQKPFDSSDPDSIRVIRLDDSAPTVTSSIAVSGKVEGITNTGDRVYAALAAFGNTPKVAILNTDDATLETEVDIGCTTRFVLADAQDEVFALCNNENSGEAVVLDGTQEQTRIPLPDSVETTGSFGQNAYYAPGAEELYVVIDKQQVVRINTATNQKSATITPQGNGSIGAIGYDPVDEQLYVGRADPSSPFSAAGRIIIHNREGEQIGAFDAGIAPTYIDFRRIEE